MVRLRTMLKNKVHAGVATRWVKYGDNLFTEEGRSFLTSLGISAIDDCLGTVEFLSGKVRELDEKVTPSQSPTGTPGSS